MKTKNIGKSLNEALLDPEVGIRHISVADMGGIGYHVAEISKGVNAHVHRKGKETYHVLEGSGKMYVGKVTFDGETPVKVAWEKPVNVEKDDVFIIDEGYAHSLQNTGGKPLRISFICPDEHLTTDRYVVDNPAAKKHPR